jgi:hypothetical protein
MQAIVVHVVDPGPVGLVSGVWVQKPFSQTSVVQGFPSSQDETIEHDIPPVPPVLVLVPPPPPLDSYANGKHPAAVISAKPDPVARTAIM